MTTLPRETDILKMKEIHVLYNCIVICQVKKKLIISIFSNNKRICIQLMPCYLTIDILYNTASD